MNPAPYSAVLAPLPRPEDWQAHLPDELNLNDPPLGAFDLFAAHLAGQSALPYAFVNWFGLVPQQMLFVGLANPPSASGLPQATRTMPELTHGYCPDVYETGRTLILNDTLAYARFASNPVIDEFGVRTYQGAQLRDPRTGKRWGTICATGPNPRARDVGRPAKQLMEHLRDLLVEAVVERSRP
ncbi:GAF domain-containing protein [Streptomyces sp. NPDC091377]|uniref:GAF domain-containing protein n=1 Tax=Streptomyces sp. NPDC091377 TaxID=3365995 RepID=UPI00380A3947